MPRFEAYKFLRRLLFEIDAETTHDLALNFLRISHRAGLIGPLVKTRFHCVPRKAMGLQFPNRVGLAAGFDKNGDCIDAMGSLGFGFVEVGTVTPRPQPGNPKPRLFRIPEHQAVVNRMGFNNKGVDHLVRRLKKSRFPGIVGVNIGKNLATSIDHAREDYLHCLKKVYPYAGYVAINVSSPNTPGLRSLQSKDRLASLLESIGAERTKLAKKNGKYVPMVVKIAPDLNDSEIKTFAEAFNDSGLDGVVATNTTVSRKGIESSGLADETGGLSGAPLKSQAEHVLEVLKTYLNERISIIASGGIVDADDAVRRIRLGADLVQLYTGLIYAGPRLIAEIVRKLENVSAE